MNSLLSFSSVKLALFSKEDVDLKPASGFVLESGNQHFLITSRHVVLGEGSGQGIKPLLLKTSIHFHSGHGQVTTPFSLGARKKVAVSLYDENGAPKWLDYRGDEPTELPDLIALPLQLDLRLFGGPIVERDVEKNSWVRDQSFWTKISAIPVSAIDTDVDYGPPDTVHVIGYPDRWAPEGTDRSSSAFWRTGFIASEMYESGMTRPHTFFIDPPASQGMSGSPVVGLKNDRLKLLGVYSDRPTTDFAASAGLVWDAYLLKDLIGAS